MTGFDFDRTARAWLDDGPIVMSDRALKAALDEIHVTRQRRPLWPARRFSSMSIQLRLLAAAAAVVVLAVAGISVLPGGGPGGPPTPSPTSTPTATPRPTSQALPADPDTLILQAGTYVAGDPFPVQVTFDAPPSGLWQGKIGGPYAVWIERTDGVAYIALQIFTKVYADPCDFSKGPLDPLRGPLVDDLATALASLPNITASLVTDVPFAGYPSKHLTLTARDSFNGCTLADGQYYRIWELPLGATNDLRQAQRQQIWILEVNGNRIVVVATDGTNDSADQKAEMEGILNSIRLAPVSPPSSPTTTP